MHASSGGAFYTLYQLTRRSRVILTLCLDKWRMRNRAMVNRGITTVSLFAIAAQLTAIRGFDFGQVLLFVAPVLFALLFSNSTPVTRGVILARVFLSLIAFGLFIAKLPWLFPDLGGVDPKLSRESDRVLTWYCATYVLFVAVHSAVKTGVL